MGGYDTYSETYSSSGVTLDFRNTSLLPMTPSSKGVWQIQKWGSLDEAILRQIADKAFRHESTGEDFMKLLKRGANSPNPRIVRVPSTVDQLLDVACFLVLARPYRAIAVFGAKG